MKANMGKIDRVFRVFVGVATLILGFVFKSWWGVIGIVPLVTAAVKVCPAYLPLGLSTCKTKTDSE